MNIEAGREYLTRGGQKATIYKIHNGQAYPVHGAIMSPIGWRSMTWDELGYHCQSGDKDSCDLVEEWTEPKKPQEPEKLEAYLIQALENNSWTIRWFKEGNFEKSSFKAESHGYKRAKDADLEL